MTTVRPLICELAPIAAITLWFLVLSQGCDTGSGQEQDVSEGVSELVKDLNDQRADVRINAARALGEIGPEAKAAVPALIETLKDEEASVRSSAAFALSRIGLAAVPALSEALKDEDRNVRGSAAVALDQIRSDANAAGQSQ